MRSLLAVLAATFACASEPPAEGCLVLGCVEVAMIDVLTVADGAELADSSIEVCHNAACVRGAVPPPSDSYDNAAYLDGALGVRVDLRPATGGVQLVATIQQVANAVADGDRYTVAVRRSDGTALTEQAWIATYSESFPNGPACDRCVHAALTPAP